MKLLARIRQKILGTRDLSECEDIGTAKIKTTSNFPPQYTGNKSYTTPFN